MAVVVLGRSLGLRFLFVFLQISPIRWMSRYASGLSTFSRDCWFVVAVRQAFF